MSLKKHKTFTKAMSLSLLLGLAFSGIAIGTFFAQHKRTYQQDEFIPEENAYYAGEIVNPSGLIKAHKFVTPTDNYYSEQKNWSHSVNMLGDLESVWTSYTGAGTTVAIIDDGFDYNHPEYIRSNGTSAILSTSRYYHLNNNQTAVVYESYSSNPSCIGEDWEEGYNGYEWATHGTNTSTTAAAPMNNGGGVGIAPEANILALKIDFSFAAIEEAIKYAINQHVDVINMSLGAYGEKFEDGFGDVQNDGYDYEDYCDIPTYLESVCQSAYNNGIIVVAAAGNEATWHKSYPACNSHVVGVGALYKNAPTTLAPFTNYINTSQTGEINVDILAPGYVYTAHQEGTQSDPTHTYNDTQGTSFSSPIVAGAACLWKQKHPSGTPDQFLEQLQMTASDIGTYESKNIPVRTYYGSSYSNQGPSNIKQGRLNVSRLLDVDPYIINKYDNVSVAIGETKQISLESYNGTLSYSSSNTSVATVSNTGLIEGKSSGTTTITITATNNGKTATSTITVNVFSIVAASAIAFNPDSITLTVGEQYDAEEIIETTPNNASRVFMFESGDTNIVTVDDETGLITAIGAGETTVYATTIYGEGEDYLTVEVEPSANPTSWDRITSTSNLANGDYLIVYEGGSKVFNGGLTTLDTTSNTISVNISSNSIPYDAATEAAKFTINSVSGGYSIKSASGKYIGRSANSNGIDTSTSEAYVNTISFSSNNVVITGTGNKVLSFNTANEQQRFRYMSSSSNIQLYKGSTSSVTPIEKELSSIAISGSYKTTFNVGDSFSFGGTVTATFSDATTADVTTACSFTGYNLSNAGNQTVTVSYTYRSVTKTTTYQISVVDSSSQQNYSHTFTYSEQGTGTGKTWSLTNCTDSSSYWLCPSGNSPSVALFPGIFDGKEITSNVVITINTATYGSGDNPTSSTYSIYNNSDCSEQVNASQSGTLPTSSSYTDVIYTVSQANASSKFVDDLAIKITKPGKQIRLKSVTVAFSYVAAAPKVISSLSASYTGSTLYVGDDLDESALTVTATFTDSVKYANAVIPSADYTLTGFNSSTAGNKTIIVTYNGALQVATSPMTTTFNVMVNEDIVNTVTVTNTKTYHPGEMIVKSDITVSLSFASGRETTTNEFTFSEDGYQFTYNDAPSGGSNGNKQFNIVYNETTYNFTVKVNRVAPVKSEGDSDVITRATTGISSGATSYSNWSNKTGTSGSIYAGNSAGGNDSIQLRSNNSNSGIVSTSSTGNVTKVTVSWNSNTQSGRKINVYGKNTAYSQATDLYSNSNQGTLLGTIVYGTNTELTISGDYAYIGIRSDSGALYLDSVTFTYAGSDYLENIANYVMYEDTNNQCLTKLDAAVERLNGLSSSDKNTFWTSNDYVIKTARERLQAWAVHQGKTLSYSDSAFVISSNNVNPLKDMVSNNVIANIVVLVSLLSISAFGVYLFINKKKEN